MKKVAYFLFIVFLTTACGVDNKSTWVVMQEDGCPPGWVDDSDRKTRLNLEGYLKGNDIVPIKIKVTGVREGDCNSCYCLTGRTFRVKVYESQVGYMAYYGFIED